MASTAISAQGSTIAIDTSLTASPVWTTIGNVRSYSGFDGEASEIDVTDLSSVAKEYRLGLIDNGKLTLNLNVDDVDAGQVALRAAVVSGAVQDFKITLPNTKTRSFSALVKSFTESGAVDGVVQGDCAMRITGAVVRA